MTEADYERFMRDMLREVWPDQDRHGLSDEIE